MYEAFPFPRSIVSSDVYFHVCETGLYHFPRVENENSGPNADNFSKKVNEIQVKNTTQKRLKVLLLLAQSSSKMIVISNNFASPFTSCTVSFS